MGYAELYDLEIAENKRLREQLKKDDEIMFSQAKRISNLESVNRLLLILMFLTISGCVLCIIFG